MGFADFYRFYLSQHANRVCRRLHSFMGDWVMWKDILTGRIRFWF